MLVSLQGAAAVCAWVLVAPLYVLRRLGAGGARAARVALLCALRSLGAGDAGCHCCVHLGAWVLVTLVAAAVCTWELGRWCCCRVPLLCAWGLGRWCRCCERLLRSASEEAAGA